MGAAARLRLRRKRSHAVLGNLAAFAARQGLPSVGQREQKLGSFAFPSFPENERLADRLLFGMQPAILNRASRECLLNGRQMNFQPDSLPFRILWWAVRLH